VSAVVKKGFGGGGGFCHQNGNQKWCHNVYNILVLVYGLMKFKIGPIILLALIAHHTPIIMSCNGTSWIDMGFSAPTG
jgi:hypothetical protein